MVKVGASGLEFWCVTLKPGERRCIRSAHRLDLIHVTMACTGENAPKGRTTVICQANGSEGAICVLSRKHQNVNLSLVLPGGENIYLEARGADTVSITGFLQPMLPLETDAITKINRWDGEIEETFNKMSEAKDLELAKLNELQEKFNNIPRRFDEGDDVSVVVNGKWIPAIVVSKNILVDTNVLGEPAVMPYLVQPEAKGQMLMVEEDDNGSIRERKKRKKKGITVVVPKIPSSQNVEPQASESPNRETPKKTTRKSGPATAKRKLNDPETPPPKRRKSWNTCSTGVKWKREKIRKQKIILKQKKPGYQYVVQKNGEAVLSQLHNVCTDKGAYSALSKFPKFQETLQKVMGSASFSGAKEGRISGRIKMKYKEQVGKKVNNYTCTLEVT